MKHSNIHPTAIIDPGAIIGHGVQIGPFSIVEKDAHVGDNSEVGAHAYIGTKTIVGKRCRIFHGAVVGTIAQDKKYKGEEATLSIGDDCVIREYCTINRGTAASGATIVGKKCTILAYCHIGHDCIVGDNVTMSNSSGMAGHVHIGDHAWISSEVGVHQFCRIGEHAFIGATSKIIKDVIPYAYCANKGHAATERIVQINKIGLAREGFSEQQRAALSRMFRILFRQSLSLEESLDMLTQTYPDNEYTRKIITFIKESKRGIYRMIV